MWSNPSLHLTFASRLRRQSHVGELNRWREGVLFDMARMPTVVVVSSAVLSVFLIAGLFVFDRREPFLYEPVGKAGYIALFCAPYVASVVAIAVSAPHALRYAKWLAMVVLVPLVPYLLLLGLFAGWASYPLLYAMLVLLASAQGAILWGVSRQSPP